MEHSQHPNPRLLSCLSWAPISLPNYRGSSKGEIFKKGGGWLCRWDPGARDGVWSGYTNPAADNIIYDPFLMDLEWQQFQSTARVGGKRQHIADAHEDDRQLCNRPHSG